jgi:hypothetical protein
MHSARVYSHWKVTASRCWFPPGTAMREIEAFSDQRVGVSGPSFARALARVQQHVLNDGVCAPAMLHDFAEIVL